MNPSDGHGIGQTLTHYRLLKKIGKGGMGEVYVAEDLTLGRRVALKILPEDGDASPERRERFQREARTVAALNHPNIVTIFSIEEDQGIRFLTMELVEGLSLRELLLGGGMDPERFLDLAIGLTEALVAAHDRGVIHRDLKPENIMVTDSGTVKVLDFGIAKLIQSDSDDTLDRVTQSLTKEGCVVGTIPYMSPEQLRGLPTGPQSDIFSLGMILFEMLSGERPFRGGSTSDVISAILRDRPQSLESFRSDISPVFDPIIGKCLNKDAKDRFQSARELLTALQDIRTELNVAYSRSTGHVRLVSKSFGLRMNRVISEPGQFLLNTRIGLCLLLLIVFLVNYVETSMESWAAESVGVSSQTGFRLAEVAHWMEGTFVFQHHASTQPVAIYGLSVSYYFLFPVLFLFCLVATARRPDIRPFRTMALAPVFAYLIHLPFFIFFPLPERWAFPDSGAVLLSDLWSTRLIETIRPISGLDNCFPSFHVSMTVIMILVAFLFRVRFRYSILCLGLTIILATLALGIHWMIDVIAGVSVGILAVWAAQKYDGRRILHSDLKLA